MLKLAYWIWNKTLNNVLFGVSTMGLIGIYIAVGSGVPAVREYFEMNELAFFSTWVLIALMVLLVLNLATVTLTRIPFTPPRYGVWCIHTGIIVLIYGMFIYYSQKVEGLILIPRGATVEHFYDSFERSLYVRADNRAALPIRLPGLPRFAAYEANTPQAAWLERRMREIRPVFMVADNSGGPPRARSLKDELGLSVEPKIELIGYHPYAVIETEFVESPGSGLTGIKLMLDDPANQQTAQEWIVDGDGDSGRSMAYQTLFEHRRVAESADIDKVIDAAGKIHRLDILVAGKGYTLFVEPGKTYPVGDTGYTLTIESFLPNWTTIDKRTVNLLTYLVQTPTQKFRRQDFPGQEKPTDWKLDVPGSGPMGERQRDKLLDENFRTTYTFADPLGLLEGRVQEKRTLVTSPDGAVTMITTGVDRPVVVDRFPTGRGEFEIVQIPPRGPFQPKLTADELANLPKVKVAFERRENVSRVDRVRDVPKAKRDRDEGQAGIRQVVTARITVGDWSKIVQVPFAQYAAEGFARWQGGGVQIPGASRLLRLQIGQTLHPMPARLTLEKFELVPYAGGEKTGGLMRDFRATLRVEDFDTAEQTVGIAKMNSPVYFDRKRPWYMPDESWLFFQSGWDMGAGERLSIIGVGNRPGVVTMTVGSVMIGAGLLYAFYVKPIIIARRKRKALEQAKKAQERTTDQATAVTV